MQHSSNMNQTEPGEASPAKVKFFQYAEEGKKSKLKTLLKNSKQYVN
jgi:hypothetical protein